MGDEEKRELIGQLWGWGMFLLCAVLFLAASIRHRDVLSGIASFLFLGGCVFFVVPLIRHIRRG
jgi:hypothetical protein